MDATGGTIRVRIVRGARGWQLLLVAVAVLVALTIAGLVGLGAAGDATGNGGHAISFDVPDWGPQSHIGGMHPRHPPGREGVRR
jgi:hypothetical protein